MKAEDESPAPYRVNPFDDSIIEKALSILKARLKVPGTLLCSPAAVKDYLKLQTATLEHEVFGMIFVDSQHAVIETEIMFRGTITQTSVYPREVLKRTLELNAKAVILFHNHPSQSPEPSRADEVLTNSLKAALDLVDVRVLDHIVVGGMRTVSMAELGLI